MNVEQLAHIIKERNGRPDGPSQIAWKTLDAADYEEWKVEPLQWAIEPIIPIGKILRGKLSAEDFSEGYRLAARSLFGAARRTGCCDVITVGDEMARNGAGAFAARELIVFAEAAPVGPVNVEQLTHIIKERNGRSDGPSQM